MRTKITKLAMFGGVALAALLVAGGAKAQTYDLLSPAFSGTFTVNTDGTLTPVGGTGTYTGIQQQDKLWNNFAITPIAGGSTTFSFANVGGLDYHTINLTNAYLLTGSPYTVSYDITVTNPLAILDSTNSGLVQTAGIASLVESLTTSPAGSSATPSTIAFSQHGAIVTSGNVSSVFAGGATSVHVSDVLTLDAGGSNVTGISNAFVESVPGVPEPASLAILGAGLASLGLVRRRRG